MNFKLVRCPVLVCFSRHSKGKGRDDHAAQASYVVLSRQILDQGMTY